MNKREPRVYPVAQLLHLHDGDTGRFWIDQGLDEWAKKWIRFKDVGAPELSDEGGPEALADVASWFNEYAPDGFVRITTFWSPGKLKEIREEMTFVRYVGLVTAPNGIELNEWLRAKGYVDRGI